MRQTLVTFVPTKMAIEKLRGFVADHNAKILKIDGSHIELEIDEKCDSCLRRLTDRPVTFQLDLRFEEQRVQRDRSNGTGGAPEAGSRGQGAGNSAGVLRTRIFVSITPRKPRDRRRADAADRAEQVLMSFRSYLMATPEDQDGPPSAGTLGKMKNALMPWLAKKK